MDGKSKQLLDVISKEQTRHANTVFGSLKERLNSYDSVAEAWHNFREHQATLQSKRIGGTQ
jgi:hypothetical protein